MTRQPPAWTNRLATAQSPYLRAHAHDPVDWWPWGDEALARAQADDKPIFLSIGYSACHWCHVMHRESFSDEATAALVNTHFVPIKVDREERPDVDALYLQSLLAIHGEAGWPATLFLLPDGRAFTGATYLPPRPMHGLPSFRQVLERVRDHYVRNRETIERAATAIADGLRPDGKTAPPVDEMRARAVREALADFDDVHAGFGHGAKFPQTPTLDLLLKSAEPAATEALSATLVAMAEGGLYDPIGGGFFRYCTDREWTVPHFEKMLDDNARLLRLYARASSVLAVDRANDKLVRRCIGVARDTAAWLVREMSIGPLFAASLDADDSEGEGRFYTFTRAEAPAPAYGIGEPHTDDGRSVPMLRGGEPSRPVRELFREAREKRPRPTRDDKRIVAWNALCVSAFAEAGRLFGNEDWIGFAIAAARELLANRHVRVVGGEVPSVLDDSACLAEALLDLYQARPDREWLDAAVLVTNEAIARFGDPTGGFYDSDNPLVVRRKTTEDGAGPSGNGVMADVLGRLVAYGVRAPDDRFWEAVGPQMNANPGLTPTLWAARPDPRAITLVVTGTADDSRTQRFLRVWNRRYRPYGLVGLAPLLEKDLTDPPVALLCTTTTCEPPYPEPESLATRLG